MNKFRFTLKMLAIATFMFAFASLTQAQASRTWVSGVGDDANPCSRTAPCKTFAGAISKTAGGGEIDALDPGGFGALTITKAITLDGGGGQVASLLVSGTNGINVNAGSTDIVIIRNLRLNGIRQTASPGVNGISFNSGKTLIVENCNIFGFSTNGINVALSATVSGNQDVSVKNTIIENCGGSGISASNTGGNVLVTVDGVHSDSNATGYNAGTGSISQLSNSTFTFSSNAGIQISAGATQVDVDTCQITSNNNGILAAASTTRIAGCRISGNGNGINFTGGAVQSFGDNKVKGNFTNDQLGGAVSLVGAPVKI
jgi:hypothetical protein